MTERPAYFHQDADGAFVGNDPARGPWSADHCHAGPVTGLIARAAERAVGDGKMLTRLTVDVLRPVPLSGVFVTADVVRNSRTLATTTVQVVARDGTVCVSGTTMHLVRKQMTDVPTAPVTPLSFTEATRADSALISGLHDKPSFGHFNEIAYAAGSPTAPGPKTIWMRTPSLLEGEDQSPIQSLCPLADCGNGISWNAPPEQIGFMNTDLTVQIHREPVSDWLASEAVSHWHDSGIGMSHAMLHDTKGPVGAALQTLVLHPPK